MTENHTAHSRNGFRLAKSGAVTLAPWFPIERLRYPADVMDCQSGRSPWLTVTLPSFPPCVLFKPPYTQVQRFSHSRYLAVYLLVRAVLVLYQPRDVIRHAGEVVFGCGELAGYPHHKAEQR